MKHSPDEQLAQFANDLLERKIIPKILLRLLKKEIAQAALKRTEGNQTQAARMIGISRQQFSRWVWDLDLKANVHIRHRPKM